MCPRSIFLDGQATTQLDPIVAEAMAPFHLHRFGNPHSLDNEHGRDVSRAIADATLMIAGSINAEPHEIFYTSGATESNNWLVHNIAYWSQTRKIHIVVSQLEHASLLEPIGRLNKNRVEVSYLVPNQHGLVSAKNVAASIRDNTVLVSVMAVNNEIGVIQPIREIGDICAEKGVLFHCDAAQAIGKIPFDVQTSNLDFASLSSHKAYGPMGIGALYISNSHIKRFEPMITGGGQQKGLRSGTLPVSLCVGMGAAYNLARERGKQDDAHLKRCQKMILSALAPYKDRFEINGSLDQRVPSNLNFQFRDKLAEHFLVTHPELSLSLGSACKSASDRGSHVLEAIGLTAEQIDRSFRLSFSRTTSENEVNNIAEIMAAYLKRS
ncbi:MAG: cysteine desulfurase family protein [Pseudomonadota bacterium]